MTGRGEPDPASEPHRRLVAGVDRRRGGWVVAIGPASEWNGPATTASKQPRADLELASVDSVESVVALTAPCAIVAVDMPMSLPASGRRTAEVDLRSWLGAAGSSVFISPTRAAIAASDQAEATLINRLHGGPGVSAQSWGLAASIRELREVLAGHVDQATWFETHPESCFAVLNGGQPMASKRTARGVGQRIQALRRLYPSIDGLLATAPSRVPVDDVLDAVAAHRSGSRIFAGTAHAFGPAGRDDEGFDHAIYV